jgi:hypothetical protein
MTRAILAILLVLGLATTALADAFQFVSGTGGALAVGAAVYSGGKLVGYTDDQGILFINVPPGTSRFQVVYRGQSRELQLNITGNPRLQQVRLP